MNLRTQWNKTNKSFREISASNGFPLPWFGQIFNIASFIEKTSAQKPIAGVSVIDWEEYSVEGYDSYQWRRRPVNGGLLVLTQDYLMHVHAFNGDKFLTIPRDGATVKGPELDASNQMYGAFEVWGRSQGYVSSAKLSDANSAPSHALYSNLARLLKFAGIYTPPEIAQQPEVRKGPSLPPL